MLGAKEISKAKINHEMIDSPPDVECKNKHSEQQPNTEHCYTYKEHATHIHPHGPCQQYT